MLSGNLSPHSDIVTVNTANVDAPILTAINPTSGSASGGTFVDVTGSGFDPAGASVAFGTTSVPATVNSPFSLTVTSPQGIANISVDVLVTNDASGLTSNVFSNGFTYLANAIPVLAAIGSQEVVEGVQLQFSTSATDPDGDTPIMTSSALPGTASYIDNGDGTGLFDWTPSYASAGIYNVTFYATDSLSSVLVDSEVVQITVIEAGNRAPIVNAINDTTIAEGQTLALQFIATDPDLDPLGLAVTNEPANVTFVDNGDGTGDFTFTPDFTQAGIYDVTFTATDTALNASSIIVQITVTNVNQLPVLAATGPQNTTEEVPLIFQVSATDADGVVPVLSTSALPGTAVFTDSLNGTGLFEWTPTFADSGVYNITFYATDADFPSDIDSEQVVITVTDAGNHAPVLAAIGAQSVIEGNNLNLVITGSDPDSTIPVLRAENLPINATFVDNLDGTGAFDFTPDYFQVGVYTVTFIVDDGVLADSEFVDITVIESGNVAPAFDSVGNFVIDEGDSLIINVTATDPDGGETYPALSVSTTLDNYTFVDNGDGTGTLVYRPDFFNAGVDTVNFLAIDFGTPQMTALAVSEITTVDVNQPPVIEPVGVFGVIVNNLLQFTITASDLTDPDTSHHLTLSNLGLPANATFTDNGDNTGLFRFIPDSTQVGLHTVSFLALDQGSPQLSVVLAVDINVVAGNIAPVLDPIGPQVTTEGQTLTINITALDPDGPPPAIEISDAPEGATLVDHGDGTATFSFTPDYYGQQRLTSVTIKAFDGISVAKELVLIQIYDAGNQAPVFDSVPNPSVIEGDSLVQGFTAYDPDRDPITLTLDESVVALPLNASFVDLGQGEGEITFYPDFNQSGIYDFYIVAWDGPEDDSTSLSDTIVVTVDVVEFGNHAPVMDLIADRTVYEDSTLAILVAASDLDGDPLVLSTGSLPTNATFVDNSDGTGIFSFSPDFDQAGSYQVMFYITDGTVTDSQLVNIDVIDVNRAPFVFAPGYSYTIYETDTLTLTIEGFDLDGTTPILSAHLSGVDTLATNMTFVDNYDGTGTLTFIPDYDQGGSESVPYDYSIMFRATDGVYSDDWQEDAPVVVGVIDRNKPPEVTFPQPGGPGPYTINEGEWVSFYIAVVDDDAISPPSLTAENMPDSNVSFTYDPVSQVGEFYFTPDFVQAGTYLVSFIATDDRGASDTGIVHIDVLEAGNQPPSFGSDLPDTLMVPTGYEYQITVAPFDPESDSISVEAYPMLPGATWAEQADGTWLYSFSADSASLGTVYEITFVVTDYPGLATDTLITHPRIVAFLRGDLDSDNIYSVNDIACLIEYLFREGPPPAVLEVGDVNGSGTVTIGDLSYLIYYMFRNGPQPVP